MKYKIWNKLDTLYTPSGQAFTKEQVFIKYPLSAVPGVQFIICDAPISMGVFMEYTQTRDSYKSSGANITDTMTSQQVLDAIYEFENRPPVVDNTPSVEERTASALEALVMLSIPDVV